MITPSDPVITLPVFTTTEKLVLASGSPRRQAFLTELGLEFTVSIPETEEVPLANERPVTFVRRMAAEKAMTVAARERDAWILAADTIVVLDNKILGKPDSREMAVRMLMELSGRSHHVLTGYSLRHDGLGKQLRRVVSTEVFFTLFSEEIAEAYVASGEPMDKAGAYGIQGKGGFLVDHLNGSCSNVVGLPLAEVVRDLLLHRVIAPA